MLQISGSWRSPKRVEPAMGPASSDVIDNNALTYVDITKDVVLKLMLNYLYEVKYVKIINKIEDGPSVSQSLAGKWNLLCFKFNFQEENDLHYFKKF